ncbi:MAG: molybdenum cofactor biosynthesis protein MoaE [Candidatus Eisenbacteria bacterium]|nr:molybdenum cofactor biosynthesis protein MoaE [Candidatus Eisenbacteria bacterium]
MPALTRARIDDAALTAAAARADLGAIVTFLGTTRDHHEGRRVTRLEYEAYEPMALEALGRIEREARGRFAIATCMIVHRLGDVPAAEASVVVVVAAEHRGPAFDACRWAMDELKRAVPIWKKEHFEGGEASWASGQTLGAD